MKNETIKLWVFYYNYCIHESVASIMSYHRTRKGAEEARRIHKAEAKKEFDEMYKENNQMRKWVKFGAHESWFVRRVDLVIQD